MLLLVLPAAAGCLGSSPSSNGAAAGTDDGNDTADADPFNYTNSSVQVRNGTVFVNGSQAHTHDYWDGRERVTILDSDFNFVDDGVDVLRSTIVLNPAPGKSVLPGTDRIVMSVDWESDRADGVVATYYFPGPTGTLQGNQPIQKGSSWEIDIDKRGWDVPHARRSLWQFTVNKGFSQVTLQDIHVTIEIVRTNRSLPMDPPHFDQFEGADSKVVFERSYSEPDPAPLAEEGRGFPIMVFPDFGESMDAIPWDAETVTVEVHWSTVVPVPPSYRVTYKTAKDLEWKQAEPVESGDEGAIYVFHPTDDETDSQYAYHSLWEFAIWREDSPEQKVVPYPDQSFRVKVTASRDGAAPQPTLG